MTQRTDVARPRKTLKRASVSAAVAVALTALAACGGTSTGTGASASKDIDVFGLVADSGSFGPVGSNIKAGMNAAAEVINNSGGILGRKVKITWVNDQSDNTKAVTALTSRLAQGTHPDMVICGSSSAECLATLPASMKAKIITVGTGNAAGDLKTYPYYFTATNSQSSASAFVVNKFKALGYHRVAILNTDNPTSALFTKQYAADLAQAGIDVVDHETYPPDTVDVSPYLQRIQQHAPDVILTSGVEPGNTAKVLNGRAKAGVSSTPIFADTSGLLENVAAQVPPDQGKNFTSVVFASVIRGEGPPGVNDLLGQLKADGIQVKVPLTAYLVSYDSIIGWANAVQQAGTVDADKVRAAAESGPTTQTFNPSLSAGWKWTPQSHLSDAKDYYSVAGLAPLVDGQFNK